MVHDHSLREPRSGRATTTGMTTVDADMSRHRHGFFHSHSHGDHHHGQNASERRLWWSLTVLAAFTAFEAVGGFLSHSIALLAEAAHMLADCGSLVLGGAGDPGEPPPRAP